ncbi:MAG: hypothetical protein M1319_01805 [Chloroflexi bacterium]|nr:hypothetical protein [Chloroflexota bacterium]
MNNWRKLAIAAAIVAVIITSLVPAALASGARQPAGPSFAIAPTYGPPALTDIKFQGTGLTPGGVVTVVFGMGIVQGDYVADSEGRISGSMRLPAPGTLPEYGYFPIDIWAIDRSSGEESAMSQFNLMTGADFSATVKQLGFAGVDNSLSPTFSDFFFKNGGVRIFGLPVTGERIDTDQEGRVYTVQYTERQRFEYHPEFRNTEYVVETGLLGRELTAGVQFPGVSAFESSADMLYVPETGHSIGHGFLHFWQENGGLQVFGYPISEELSEQNPPPPAGDGQVHTVQYFERARFEYHPEFKGTPYEVELGLLGSKLLAAH